MVPSVCLRPRKSAVKSFEHARESTFHRLASHRFAISGKVPAFALRPLLRRPRKADEADRLCCRSPRRSRDSRNCNRYRAPASLQGPERELERGLLAHGAVALQRLALYSEQLLLGGVRVHDESALEPFRRACDGGHYLRNPSAGARFRGDEHPCALTQPLAYSRRQRLERVRAHRTNRFTSARTTSA